MNIHKILTNITVLIISSGMLAPAVSASTTSHHVFPEAEQDYSQENQTIKSQEWSFLQSRLPYHYGNVSKNTRDLGGYLAMHGTKQIKPDKLIRSDCLYYMNHRNYYHLRHLHVEHIIDLRNNVQIENKPDPNETVYGIKYHNKHHVHSNIPVTKDAVFNTQEWDNTKQGSDLFGGSYRYSNILSTNPKARQSYKEALNDMLNNKHGAVLYHCIAGRDRTGVLSAIILSALGVKRSTIYQDYLLSNYYGVHHSFVSQYNQLYTFFNTVDSKYGSMRNYLHSLGMNNHKIHKLRAMYLEPVK